jgi:hypothetical protein
VFEGAFLGGSLASGRADEYSDVDLAVVAAPGREDEAWELRADVAAVPGRPLRVLERSWPGARMVACLYSAEEFPPLGLEVDVAFVALDDVGAAMPYAPARVVADRSGRVAEALASVPDAPTAEFLAGEVAQRRTWFSFYVHDALVASRRGDLPQLAFLLGQMVEAVVAVAAARAGELGVWAKGGPRWLSPAEVALLRDALRAPGDEAVMRLRELFERYAGD